MLKIYTLLASLIVLPVIAFSIGRRTLTTELEFMERNAGEIEAKRKDLARIGARVPAAGSIVKNAPPKRLDPLPVCDFATRRSNVQRIHAWMLKKLDPDPSISRPIDYASVLSFVLRRNLRDPSVEQRIWGYEETVRNALDARYLLVEQYSASKTPRDAESSFTEGFLFDLATGELVDAFRYPPGRITDLRPRFLSARWNTTISPQISPRTNLVSGDVDHITT